MIRLSSYRLIDLSKFGKIAGTQVTAWHLVSPEFPATIMDQLPNLRSLFSSARESKVALESRGDTTTTAYRDEIKATISKFQECQRQISILSLFSSNESLDDVASGDIRYFTLQRSIHPSSLSWSGWLRYMTLEYHLAELIQRSPSSDREAVLSQALEQYEKFLTRLDEYGLLSRGDKKLFEDYMANPTSFTLAPMNDAAVRRETKVKRFREEKELKQKLEVGSKH